MSCCNSCCIVVRVCTIIMNALGGCDWNIEQIIIVRCQCTDKYRRHHLQEACGGFDIYQSHPTSPCPCLCVCTYFLFFTHTYITINYSYLTVDTIPSNNTESVCERAEGPIGLLWFKDLYGVKVADLMRNDR